MRGAGRTLFAAIMLVMLGTLNIIYGIGALDDANFVDWRTRFILDDLNTLGWVLIIVGALELTGGFSLMGGGGYGKFIGILAGTLGAISAFFSIGGAIPGGHPDVHPVHLDRPRSHHVRRGSDVRRGARLSNKLAVGGSMAEAARFGFAAGSSLPGCSRGSLW